MIHLSMKQITSYKQRPTLQLSHHIGKNGDMSKSKVTIQFPVLLVMEQVGPSCLITNLHTAMIITSHVDMKQVYSELRNHTYEVSVQIAGCRKQFCFVIRSEKAVGIINFSQRDAKYRRGKRKVVNYKNSLEYPAWPEYK